MGDGEARMLGARITEVNGVGFCNDSSTMPSRDKRARLKPVLWKKLKRFNTEV